MWDDEEWEKKPIQEGLHRHAGELVLQTYGNFLEEYSSQLQAIQEVVSVNNELKFYPVQIQIEPEESGPVTDLVDTNNKILNKVIIVFSTLCLEVRALEEELNSQYLDTLLYYGEGVDTNALEGQPQLMISKLLPVLQDLMSFVKRCYQVVNQLVLQLIAFYALAKENSKSLTPADLHMQDVLEHTGQLLVMLVTLDEVLMSHMTLRDHWNCYQHSVSKAVHESARFHVDSGKTKMLGKMLKQINSTLLSGTIFQNVLQLPFERNGPATKNSELSEEMDKYIRSALNEVETKVLTDPEVQMTWASVCTLYTFYVHLFGSSDKKLFKQFWELSKKVPSVTLNGNIVWFPDQFLCQHLTHLSKKLVDKKAQEAVVNARINYIQISSSNLPKLISSFSFQVFAWILQMESILKKDLANFKVDDIKVMCNYYLEGIQLSLKMHKLLTNLTNLHGSMAKPMTKSSVIGLCRLVELVKTVRETYLRNQAVIARSVGHIIQRLSFQALSIIAAAKKGLMSDKKFSEKHVDMLSSLVLAEKCLNGPPTRERLLVARIALSVANQKQTFRDEDLTSLSVTLASLARIPRLIHRLEQATNCNFLYWHRVILPIYFTALYESKGHLHGIKYILEAIEDSVKDMHGSLQPQIMRPLDGEITQQLNAKILKPLCEEIETNLRLHAHAHLQSQEISLPSLKADCKNIMSLPPVLLFCRLIHLKGKVGNYLEHTFYDLTTVALHDWRTYGEMRCLAQHKYRISTVEDTLPSQTLEQGLDVLEIMRNIHIFVSKYQYNLNNQIFIEYSSNNKHLNTINIRHIANSIRTHGTGIMNTTVNFTYQFLRKKLITFSQFLYDEHIKSRLMKDLCFFRDNKEQLDSKYSYERAEKFNRGIRRLGVTPDGLTYLDQFRILITQIGNAMGYVRMIRSGGLHCCSNAIRYIPDLENIVSLEELTKEEGLSETCVQTAAALDQVITNMRRNLTEGSEYFKLLVDVFAPVLRDKKNSHLWNFHMIVPPLTINFCEHMITAKEKISKKSKVGASFTDDGFAMGIAYVLSVLNLNAEFESLHWFKSIKDKYSTELASVAKQKQLLTKEEEKLQQTLNLTAKRLEIYHQEFQLLFYSLSSAQVFFQRDLTQSQTNLPPGEDKSNQDSSTQK
ncbi:WASH complex subunit 4-like [Macrosteles quadrilineatus]|uniref:WASH complex subunit 4-like n=1 Tax=Macrosteles quadrilineatus TaxID=74068 RepID=UPI0023E0A82A|nr:WASH complex subunit 4-like [Macrosteles quadrilineatus]XP_054280862.1 WASH complex subunit 4-like [Macrosteles quadrilineatus]